MKKLNGVVAAVGLAVAFTAHATDDQSARTITQYTVGNDGVVTLVVSGGNLTGSSVSTCNTKIAFLATTDTGKVIASTLMSAFLAGKTVTFHLQGCYGGTSSSAAIVWFDVT